MANIRFNLTPAHFAQIRAVAAARNCSVAQLAQTIIERQLDVVGGDMSPIAQLHRRLDALESRTSQVNDTLANSGKSNAELKAAIELVATQREELAQLILGNTLWLKAFISSLEQSGLVKSETDASTGMSRGAA
jgi:hypothetical protein